MKKVQHQMLDRLAFGVALHKHGSYIEAIYFFIRSARSTYYITRT
jgi:hypothetical protein